MTEKYVYFNNECFMYIEYRINLHSLKTISWKELKELSEISKYISKFIDDQHLVVTFSERYYLHVYMYFRSISVYETRKSSSSFS